MTTLDDLLREAGMGDADGDPLVVWRELRRRLGDRVAVIELYGLAGRARGLSPHEVPRNERLALSEAILPVLYPGHESTPGSRRDDGIEIVAYDESWPARFERWRDRVVEALGPVARRVEHVGSTAVPGLPAKPVIDVQISVTDESDEGLYVPALESIGLQLRSRDDRHHYFRPFASRPRDVHVHVCSVGGSWERDHLLFRDFLRADTAARHDYARAKDEAARWWSDDRIAYTEAKGTVIRRLLREGGDWSVNSGEGQ